MEHPVQKRSGYRERKKHPVSVDLGKLAEKHGLTGAVLVTFDMRSGRMGTACSAENELFLIAMNKLSSDILELLANGTLAPVFSQSEVN